MTGDMKIIFSGHIPEIMVQVYTPIIGLGRRIWGVYDQENYDTRLFTDIIQKYTQKVLCY